MNMLILLIVIGLRSVAPTPLETHLATAALEDCPTNKAPKASVVWGLLAMERAAGLPTVARGISLAAACRESAFLAEGKAGDGGVSVGMFQFARWAKRHIRSDRADPRLDWVASADFWLRHLRRQVRAVRKRCTGRRGYDTHEEMIWASANTTAVRSPRCWKRLEDGRCVERGPWCASRGRGNETRHWLTLRRWRRYQPSATVVATGGLL